VGSLKRVRAQGGSLTLAANTDRIVRVFRITGLIRAFTLHPSIPEAIADNEHWPAALAREGHGTEEWCRKNGLL
jgi:anti-sigma B factor antagonist